MISNFSASQSAQQPDPGGNALDFLMTLPAMLGIPPPSLIRHTSVESVILFQYFSTLKDFLCALYTVLNVDSQRLMYFFSLYPGRLDVNVTLYPIFDG